MSKHAIQCWNCGTRLTLDERSENDGECPECDSELALDDYFEDALTERDELRAQVEAMQVDAERYRWMRASFVRNHNHSFTWYLSMFEPLTAEGLDSNVDSARKAKP